MKKSEELYGRMLSVSFSVATGTALLGSKGEKFLIQSCRAASGTKEIGRAHV